MSTAIGVSSMHVAVAPTCAVAFIYALRNRSVCKWTRMIKSRTLGTPSQTRAFLFVLVSFQGVSVVASIGLSWWPTSCRLGAREGIQKA